MLTQNVQEHPFPDGKLPYGWESVGEYWPHRLLHIPTMTAIERDENDNYRTAEKTAHKPKYGILTYTWGHWVIRDEAGGPTLPVKGISWKIPPTKDEHFTVEAFQKVVNKMLESGVEWAWIDIACIDQEDEKDKATEIGRQASIFKQVHKVFVWLCRLHTETLASTVQDVQKYGIGLREYIDRLNSRWEPQSLIDNLQKALDYIFKDPWFTSIWTLQEVVLRNDALVLPAEVEPVWWDPNEHYTFLTMFINHCQNIYQDLEKLERRPNLLPAENKQTIIDGILATKKQILQVGFYYLFSTNPNVQYGSVRYRMTSREEDRVYAIMQIYNIRLGNQRARMITPHWKSSLTSLLWR